MEINLRLVIEIAVLVGSLGVYVQMVRNNSRRIERLERFVDTLTENAMAERDALRLQQGKDQG